MTYGDSIWRLDMHCHTCHSPDSLLGPEAFVRGALRAGLDAVFLTDHDTIAAVEPVRQAALQIADGRLRVFAGQEISTTRGEIIGLFVTERIPPGLTPKQALDALEAQGALACLPHPFARLVPSRLALSDTLALAHRFHVVEVVNARNILRRDDDRARAFARERGLLMGAGSDAHWGWDLGRAHVALPPFDSPESLLRSLAEGQVVDRKKSSYLLAGCNAAFYPLRRLWWRWRGDERYLAE